MKRETIRMLHDPSFSILYALLEGWEENIGKGYKRHVTKTYLIQHVSPSFERDALEHGKHG